MTGSTETSTPAPATDRPLQLAVELHMKHVEKIVRAVERARRDRVQVSGTVSTHGVPRAVFDALPIPEGLGVTEWRVPGRGVYWSKPLVKSKPPHYVEATAYTNEPPTSTSPEVANVVDQTKGA